MQQAVNTWEGGLQATGGALVPEKSWIHRIKHVWDTKGVYILAHTDDLDIHFTVKNSNKEVKLLQLVAPMEAKETLGVFLSPDRSISTQKLIYETKYSNGPKK